MRLTALANDAETTFDPELSSVLEEYESRYAAREATWKEAFEDLAGPLPAE